MFSWLLRGLGAFCEATTRFASDVVATKHFDGLDDERLVAIARADPQRGKRAYEVLGCPAARLSCASKLSRGRFFPGVVANHRDASGVQ